METGPADSRALTPLSENTGRIIIVCLLCVGIGLLILALLSTIKLVQLRLFGHETTGHVVSQKIMEERVEKSDNGREYTEDIERYYAVVSFKTEAGTFTINSYNAGTNVPLYPTDSQVTVIYRPGHPEGARIQQEISGFSGIFGPLMLFVFGAALIGASRLVKFIIKV